MDLHRLVLFCHVTAVIGLVAALVIEGVSLTSLRRAGSYEQAREWAGLWSLLMPLGLPSLLVIVASGIYLATTFGLWESGWAKAAIPMLIIIGLAGGIVGPRRKRLEATIATSAGPLPGELRIQLRQPLFLASWLFRAALIIALVFDMTAKPDLGSVPLIGAATLIGLVVSLPVWIAHPRTSADQT